MGTDIEADGIGKLDRAHRHAERARRLVDLLLGLALLERGAWRPSCTEPARG